jgi:hypothetical protein
MSAGNYDILVEQGATFLLTITIKDTSGVPIDLTGQTFRGKIKKSFSDVTAQATFVCTLANQLTDPGKVTISLSAVDTAAIVINTQGTARVLTTMVYDIESEIAGVVKRWLQGLAKISPEVTKP